MHKTLKTLVPFLFLPFSATLHAAPPLLQEHVQQEPTRLLIQNRILAKVHTKTISVLDVVKKMEVFLNKYYPQYIDSVPAKYQYFSTQWKETLAQMIDQELILADADKMELKITDGEVREQLFDRFGPNVMASLDKLNLSYEEARAMIHAELSVQRMTWFKVHAKALASVNTQDLKQAYASFIKNNPAKETWEYRILSLRSQDEEQVRALAQKAFDLCHQQSDHIESVIDELKAPSLSEEAPPYTLSLSEPIQTEDKDLSSLYKEILGKLEAGAISAPVKQVNKGTQSGSLYRIFHLIKHVKTPPPSFRSMQEKLHNQLVQEAVEKESRQYITKLRKRYGFDTVSLEETIPSGFQPFSLQ